MSDPVDDPKLKAYFRHAKDYLFPKLKGSALSLTILNGDPDPKLCLEIGAAIMFDKPLIVLVPNGTPIPANLKRLAAAIVQGDPLTDSGVYDRLQQAIKEVLANDQRTKQ